MAQIIDGSKQFTNVQPFVTKGNIVDDTFTQFASARTYVSEDLTQSVKSNKSERRNEKKEVTDTIYTQEPVTVSGTVQFKDSTPAISFGDVVFLKTWYGQTATPFYTADTQFVVTEVDYAEKAGEFMTQKVTLSKLNKAVTITP